MQGEVLEKKSLLKRPNGNAAAPAARPPLLYYDLHEHNHLYCPHNMCIHGMCAAAVMRES